MSSLLNRLMLSPSVQVAVKALRVPQLANALLRASGTTRVLPGTKLRCRVRYSDTLLLIDGLFRGGEYAFIESDAANIRTFIDLGCNVGLFPLYLCALRGDQDIAGILVDANPQMVEEARANLLLNAIDKNARVVHGLADGGARGAQRAFFVTPNSLSSTSHADMLGSSFGSKQIQVPVVDVAAELDAHLGAHTRVDLLKLDIEGCELDFLRDSAGLLSRCDRVVLEFHKPKATLTAVSAVLSEHGFQLRASREDVTEPWGIAYYGR